MKKFLNDFKQFAMRGNVVDMAVGVIIGGAFGKIVSSLVEDIIMPVVSVLCGKIDIAGASFIIESFGENGSIEIKYGLFLQNILDFLIIALCVFTAIKLINSTRRKTPDEPEEVCAPAPSREEELLAEIRDILIKESKKS